MPIHENEAKRCRETYAGFRVFGAAVDPLVVTRRLGLTPDGQSRCGEQAAWSRRPLALELGTWWLESRHREASNILERHIDVLLKLLAKKRSEVLELSMESGVSVDVMCYWSGTLGYGGPVLSPRILAELGSLGVTLTLDVYP